MAGIRVHLVIVFLLLTLAILVAGNFIYQKYYLTEPLFKLYQNTKVVQDYHLDEDGTVKVVQVKMKKTANLQKSYQELLEVTGKVMGTSQFTLEIKDKRNAGLEKVYSDSQLVIFEALAKGSFTEMDKVIKDNAKAAGAQANVFMDRENIYVQLFQGNNYLYEIVPRDQNPEKPLETQGGSDTNA